jgi:hypothetical protein
MQLNINEVYSIKISNGDELVAKVVANDDNTITLSSPLTVLPSPQGIQLMPSLFTAEMDAVVTVNKTNITLFAEVRDQVRDSYIESTTGIAPVRKQIITG